MIQEPPVITGARYPRISDVTADDMVRLPASLPAALAGAQQELEAGAEVPPSSSKHAEELLSQKVLAWSWKNSNLVYSTLSMPSLFEL